jgi:predicted anti-sigma-YlaC factor YlaD
MKIGDKKLSLKARHNHKYFYDWYRQELDEKMRYQVESHLKTCADCQQYYKKMSTLLDQPDLSALPHLTPDPYLPEKIIQGRSSQFSPKKSGAVARYIRWSFATVLVVLSFTLGIFLGKGIFYSKNTNYESQLTSDYYQHFSQSSVLEEFDQIVNFANEE